jgi:hypothetical protein
MSLATTAATWTTDDIPPPVASKKRQSTVRTATEMIGVSGSSAFDSGTLPKLTHPTVEHMQARTDMPNGHTDRPNDGIMKIQEHNEVRKVKVNTLLDKLTSKGSTEGLVDYVPQTSRISSHSPSPSMFLPKTDPVQLYKLPAIDRTHGDYVPAGISPANSFGAAYTPTHTGGPPVKDDKLLEKINYMIHLLEEQKMEKTNYVMEEFVLYTMLGVFVIYVVDSFSRSAKYIR